MYINKLFIFLIYIHNTLRINYIVIQRFYSEFFICDSGLVYNDYITQLLVKINENNTNSKKYEF